MVGADTADRTRAERGERGMITRPMKATQIEDYSKICFPVIVTPKIDGIRCLKVGGCALAASFKPIPNAYVRSVVERPEIPDGLDGELIVPGAFQDVTSAIMSRDGEPPFEWHIFDWYMPEPYHYRVEKLAAWFDQSAPGHLVFVEPERITTLPELQAYIEKTLAAGFEGVMVRSPDGPYKCGRATVREGYLLKIKPFADAEALVVGFEEQYHNINPPEINELGLMRRSLSIAGKVPAGTLGKFLCRDLATGVEFELGTGVGLTHALRKEVWGHREKYLGKLVTYKYQKIGTKDAPRQPIFKGFRDPLDMGSDK